MSLTQYRNGEIIPIGIAPRENNEIKSTMERVGSAIAVHPAVGLAPSSTYINPFLVVRLGGMPDSAEPPK